MKKSTILILAFACMALCSALAQPQRSMVQVLVIPESADWIYELNERADFQVSVLLNGQALPDTKVSYSIGYEQMAPATSGELPLPKGIGKLKGITGKTAGFIRCTATVVHAGKTYQGVGTAAFAPHTIEPTVANPADFDEFWQQAKAELAEVPLEPKITLVPEWCNAEVNVYHVSLQHLKMPHSWLGNGRVYGVLSVPKAAGKYPAILEVPGAGVYPRGPDYRANRGYITFNIGIHGIPLNLPEEVYPALSNGALSGYYFFNLDNRDAYYYKRVYLGCIRAVDFIYSLPEFNGEQLAVTGGSQGGALAIVTASLDERVKYLAAYYPALSDVTGYLHGRAGGWPHAFKDYDAKARPEWPTVIAYYDVVNFARRLKVPGWYTWGFNDNVCPPTSMYAAYNTISAPKELQLFPETAHWTYPEQREMATHWLFEQLGRKGN